MMAIDGNRFRTPNLSRPPLGSCFVVRCLHALGAEGYMLAMQLLSVQPATVCATVRLPVRLLREWGVCDINKRKIDAGERRDAGLVRLPENQ